MSGTGAYDSQIIGHVCVDVNVDVTGAESRVIGGAAACAAGAAVSLGHRVEVVTAVGEGDEDLLSCFPPAVERIIAVPSRRTTSIRNVYRTQDRERRVSHGLEQGDPIGPEDVPDEPVGVRHLAGLIVGDYAPDMVDSLSGRGDTAVDMQAFLRVRSQRTGELDLRGSTAGEDFFGRIRYLKVDAAEGEALTGLSDRRDMARALRDRGAREVMVSGPAEMLVLDDSGFHSCPLRPRTMVGRTGPGRHGVLRLHHRAARARGAAGPADGLRHGVAQDGEAGAPGLRAPRDRGLPASPLLGPDRRPTGGRP